MGWLRVIKKAQVDIFESQWQRSKVLVALGIPFLKECVLVQFSLKSIS